MRGSPYVFLILAVLVGCGGDETVPDGGDSAGDVPADAAGSEGVADRGDGLLRCALTSRPREPVGDGGLADAPKNDAGQPQCNDVTINGSWLDWEAFTAASGGIALPGGAAELPQGGVVVDGDYDLVRFRQNNVGTSRTRRSIRVFEHGTHVEWAVDIDDPENFVGSGTFNTTMTARGTNLNVDAIDCDSFGTFRTPLYGYTVDHDLLKLYVYGVTGAPNDQEIQTAYTYQRRCTR